MVDLSAYGLGQFELPSEDIFYDDTPNCRGPLRNLNKTPRPPRPHVRYPDKPSDDVFLASVASKQPLSVQRLAAYPDKNILSGIAWDFTSRFVGDYRLRRNFHRVLTTLLLKDSYEGSDLYSLTEQAGIDEDIWQFSADRHLPTSLLLRSNFSLRQIAAGHETPFEQSLFSQLYRGIFDRDYRRWGKTHLRYRDGPRRPGLLLVARSRSQETAVAECPLQIVSWPSVDTGELYEPYDEALWNSLGGKEKLDACEILLRDEADDEELDEYRERWLEYGQVPPNTFLNLRPAEAEQVRRDAHMPYLRRKAWKAFAAACANLLNLFDMCGTVYGCVVADRRFSRMYLLSRGRIAVELSNAGELVDLACPVQERFGLPYSRIRDLDLYASLACRIADDELRPPPEPRLFRWNLRGDQSVEPPEENQTPSEEWGERRVTPDLAGLQTLIDFLAAGVTRLGALKSSGAERLPTPVQDRWDAAIDHALMLKGLPPELATRIRHESTFLDALAGYLRFTEEEEARRPQSRGLWRGIVRRWEEGLTSGTGWDTPSAEDSDDEADDNASTLGGTSHGEWLAPGGQPPDELASFASGEVDPQAIDEGVNEDEDEDADDGAGSDFSSTFFSERTRHWLRDTGSIKGTDAHCRDWDVFDWGGWGNVELDDAESVGYSACSAEADYYEEYHRLDNDACFVLSIAERILQETCHIVPFTKEEMDELVQAQYQLDLQRYK